MTSAAHTTPNSKGYVMTDHKQAEATRRTMLLRAEEIDRERAEFAVPHHPDDLPTMQNASNGLSILNSLVQDLCEDLHCLSRTPDPAPALDATIDAYARAAGYLSQAAGHYGATVRQLGFLRRHSQRPEHPQLREARNAAFTTIQQCTAETRDSLASARAALHGGADDLEAPSLSRAARARSTQAEPARSQTASEAAEHAAAPGQQPTQAPEAVRAR